MLDGEKVESKIGRRGWESKTSKQKEIGKHSRSNPILYTAKPISSNVVQTEGRHQGAASDACYWNSAFDVGRCDVSDP